MPDTTANSSRNNKIQLREVFIKFALHWKWFLVSLAISITFAFLYLKFATYEYQVSSIILINDEGNDGGSSSEISTFADLGLFEGPKISLDTEIGILKSKTLIESVVKELQLNVTYYTKSGFSFKEVYQKEKPFNVNLVVDDLKINELDTIFSINATSTTKYNLLDIDGNQLGEGSFGEVIPCEFGSLVATPAAIDSVIAGDEITIRIRPIEDVSIDLTKRIEVVPDNLNSNLIVLKLQDPLKSKAKDILDNLVINYNKDAIEYKRRIAQNTDEFVSNRIDDISVELKSLDQGVQSYKTKNNLSNLDSEASLAIASNVDLGNRIVEITSQIKLIDYVMEYMKSNTEDLIPANLGLLNENDGQNTINYNNLILERNRLSTSANKENPVILNLNNQIENLRESIDRSLLNTRTSLKISLDDAKLQEIKLNSKISSNPKQVREIRDIQRQQETYETLYLYLLQKREENSISLAVTAPNAKIVDKAYGSRDPVAPRKMIVLLASIMLGLIMPVSLITIRSLFNNKINTPEEIEDILQTSTIGCIPPLTSKNEFIAFNKGQSNVAESFRLLRTNVNYLLLNHTKDSTISQKKVYESTVETEEVSSMEKIMFDSYFDTVKSENKGFVGGQRSFKEAKIIMISSTIRKEGKTFVALNLGTSLALLNKKVLFIEADLRNPAVSTYLKKKKQKGLTQFLTDRSLGLSDVIMHDQETDLDILGAGSVPSNPAELLANERFTELLIQSKQCYDYIIVDTSALNIATDTLLLSHYADLFIYVLRANFLSEKLLHIPRKMYDNKRLPNMVFLMNGTDYTKTGYDSTYSFGESEGNNKSWIKRMLG
ncbi:GumC family protein [Pareuzebyella sediminis]|uniref:GumC family protein n=1 Tax=Pareuzebyella sediminis TaxID=2607998 RepID=UPI0018E0EAED|nr:tyrosine-protein kinase family protein [Pareuzebyella sediminis]